MALVADMIQKFPPITEVEQALSKLYDNHKQEYRATMESEGLDYDEEARNDPWRGIYAYQWAEYRDSNGKYVPENKAKVTGAALCMGLYRKRLDHHVV